MTPSRAVLAVAVSIGVAVGACAREVVRAAVISDAHAQTQAAPGLKKEYMVRGHSGNREGGYESDLNRLTEDGWTFVGVIPVERGSHMIFERPKQN